jgi:hypothetical protein
MEDIIQLNQDYQILICRLCQAAIRPGSSIELHFRRQHQLKGQVLSYWNDRYYTQPNLARMALDVLAASSMSDECERLFRSAKILLSDRRSRPKIDIIKASECLRSWFGPPAQNTSKDINIGRLKGESDLQGTRHGGEGI